MALKNLNHRPINKDDVIEHYGKPFNATMRGFVVELDGEMVAIGGVLHTSPLQAFSLITDKMRKNKRCFVYSARAMRELLSKYDHIVLAEADPKIDKSREYLEYIGFELYHGRFYKWQKPQVQWPQPKQSLA